MMQHNRKEPALTHRDITPCAATLSLRVPLFASAVRAGFPSPADDYIEKRVDFNELLVNHPAATFCVRATGNSMRDAGIAPGDILVVDRALTPSDGKIVIAAVNGELTVKRLRRRGEKVFLMPENPDYPSIEISAETGFEVWGVVTHVIHRAE